MNAGLNIGIGCLEGIEVVVGRNYLVVKGWRRNRDTRGRAAVPNLPELGSREKNPAQVGIGPEVKRNAHVLARVDIRAKDVAIDQSVVDRPTAWRTCDAT